MGRKSTKENKNIYQTSREDMNWTRSKAAKELFISEDRIEKIESEKSLPHPDEILTMDLIILPQELKIFFSLYWMNF